MNLQNFYERLTELNTQSNKDKEILVAYQEQFAKIKSINLTSSFVLEIKTTNIEDDTIIKTIDDLKNKITDIISNYDNMKYYTIHIDGNQQPILDIAEDIENTITIGLIEF